MMIEMIVIWMLVVEVRVLEERRQTLVKRQLRRVSRLGLYV